MIPRPAHIAGLILLVSMSSGAWTPKQAPLMTRWAATVDSNSPLPEYPRPQMVRGDWLNLNGVWQFQTGAVGGPVPVGQTLSQQILVPFAIESALSGIMQLVNSTTWVWYRRMFTVPGAWSGKRIMLNFGAVDWESEVFVNGTSVGVHRGGYDPFSYDLTSYLTGSGSQELIVRVFDPTQDGRQPRGKQCRGGSGIVYTPTTGIWQTVWLEPVPQTGIGATRIVPDIDNAAVKLTTTVTGPTDSISVRATVMDGGGVVQTVTGNPGAQLSIPVPSPKLWSPDNPFLYGLSIALTRNGNVVDSVGSYFGMRKISIGTVDGHLKMLLNNAFTFEIGPLDQGYWPDGNYTAPTDEALKSDLETAKAFGFNMVRKHVKVEPYRWYYWADMLGLLVWQDMPSAITYGSSLPPDTAEFLSELTRMVQTHWNSPSIIMWVVFNEGCGQHNTQSLVAAVKGLDPSRLADEASGSTLYGYGDVRDVHSYPRPACPTSATEALACGEYGGLGYLIAGHSWDPNNPYVPKVVADAAAHNSLYNDYMNYLAYLKTNNGLSAAVYTQLTDVENEYDGLMTYDRAVFRGDTALLRGCAEKLGKTLSLVEILPMSQTQAQTWRYTTAAPDSTWITPSFNDAAWSSGQAGFGTIGGARTTWNSADIWLRRHFNPGAVSSSDRADLMLNIFHDEGSEVYLNGVPACTTTGYTTTYALELVSLAAKNALIANADNCIAVHCHQTAGGQFIDVGMQRMDYSDGSTATANGRLTHASSGGEGRISFIGVPGGLRVACGTSSEGGVLKVVVCNPSGQLVWRSEKHTLEGHDCTICTVDRLSHGFYLVKAIRTGPHGEVLSAHAGTLVVPGNR